MALFDDLDPKLADCLAAVVRRYQPITVHCCLEAIRQQVCLLSVARSRSASSNRLRRDS